MLEYDFPLYRPPSEAENLIIQMTLGCSFNRCSFCSMYRSKEYELRSIEDVRHDIEEAARYAPESRRVFLADGDAYGAPTEHLLEVIAILRENFPNLQRVSAYAWPLNILKKSDAEIRELKDAGLSLLYVGLESGDDELLKIIRKGANSKMHGECITRARNAGVKISATVILGLGGMDYTEQHVENTTKLVNAAPPNYLSTLQVGLADEIRDEFLGRFPKTFQPLEDHGMLLEQRAILERLNPTRPVIFRSNHASNALALAGNLPKDRDRLIAQIDAVLAGDANVRPRWMRGY